MNAHIQNKIIERLHSIDSFQLREVLDFVEYLSSKNKNPSFGYENIDLLFGKYKDALSSSDEFARWKKSEKEIEK